MKNIIIDTCVLIHIIRDTDAGKKCIEEISKFDSDPNIIISVVTKAEMESFVIQNNWGVNKIEKFNRLLNDITIIDIVENDNQLINEYSKIDSYSKRKSIDKLGNKLLGAAKTMGKNDLWIAATASALDIPLITADSDFDHLKDSFIDVIKIVRIK